LTSVNNPVEGLALPFIAVFYHLRPVGGGGRLSGKENGRLDALDGAAVGACLWEGDADAEVFAH
jgi:hypothetical protein